MREQVRHARKTRRLRSRPRKMIERRQRMGFAPAELRNQCEHRRRVLRLAHKAPKHHAGVVVECARKTGAREEL